MLCKSTVITGQGDIPKVVRVSVLQIVLPKKKLIRVVTNHVFMNIVQSDHLKYILTSFITSLSIFIGCTSATKVKAFVRSKFFLFSTNIWT
jgi:hypothetical protein